MPGLRALLLVLLVALVSAACGGGTPRKGRTVTFTTAGNFPPLTITGTYSVHGCEVDTHTVVDDALLYYRHSNGAPGPADLYYYNLREAYAHFEADACTNEALGQAMKRRLSTRQRAFLLDNVASDLHRAFQAALNS
jgi:hypothetical protein